MLCAINAHVGSLSKNIELSTQNIDVKKSYSSLANPHQETTNYNIDHFALNNRQDLKYGLYCINVRARSRRLCPELSVRKLTQNDNLLQIYRQNQEIKLDHIRRL